METLTTRLQHVDAIWPPPDSAIFEKYEVLRVSGRRTSISGISLEHDRWIFCDARMYCDSIMFVVLGAATSTSILQKVGSSVCRLPHL
jgi:hypothetical protein